MRRGISFEIPNEYGHFLKDILTPIRIANYNWYIGGEESYILEDNEKLLPLFPREIIGLEGSSLKETIDSNNKQYLIFLNIKAYPKGIAVYDVDTYDQFQKSDCHLVILVVDSVYVTIYCKDQYLIDQFYAIALTKRYDNIEFVTDSNDFRTRLSVW